MVGSRDVDKARASLAEWIRARHPDARSVTVADLTCPSSGFSGELLLCDATWSDGGEAIRQRMAVRVEPAGHQVFLDARFEEQYRVQEILGARSAVPVPRTIAFEHDTSFFGSRFYVTERVPGRPVDPLGSEPWWLRMEPGDQRRVWFGCLDEMAGVHRLDWAALGLDFLDEPTRGADHLSQQLHYYREFYDWSVADGGIRQPVIEATLDRLDDRRPTTVAPSALLWGDARHGNILYDDRGRTTAVIDWEMTALGAPETDLGWCVALDRMSRKHPSYAPFPTMDASLAHYEERLGRPLEDLDYHVTFALVRSAVIVNRLMTLARRINMPLAMTNPAVAVLSRQLGAASGHHSISTTKEDFHD